MAALRRPNGYWQVKNPKPGYLSCITANYCMSLWKPLFCEKNFAHCLQKKNWPKRIGDWKN